MTIIAQFYNQVVFWTQNEGLISFSSQNKCYLLELLFSIFLNFELIWIVNLMSFGDGRWFAGGSVFLCNPLLCFVDIFSIHKHHKILMKLLEFCGRSFRVGWKKYQQTDERYITHNSRNCREIITVWLRHDNKRKSNIRCHSLSFIY